MIHALRLRIQEILPGSGPKALSDCNFFQPFLEENAIGTVHAFYLPRALFGAAHFPGKEPAVQALSGYPGRAIGSDSGRAFNFKPTTVKAAKQILIHREKKEVQDALDIGRNAPPSLLITFHSLERDAKELCHFLLRTLKPGAKTCKFQVGHND